MRVLVPVLYGSWCFVGITTVLLHAFFSLCLSPTLSACYILLLVTCGTILEILVDTSKWRHAKICFWSRVLFTGIMAVLCFGFVAVGWIDGHFFSTKGGTGIVSSPLGDLVALALTIPLFLSFILKFVISTLRRSDGAYFWGMRIFGCGWAGLLLVPFLIYSGAFLRWLDWIETYQAAAVVEEAQSPSGRLRVRYYCMTSSAHIRDNAKIRVELSSHGGLLRRTVYYSEGEELFEGNKSLISWEREDVLLILDAAHYLRSIRINVGAE